MDMVRTADETRRHRKRVANRVFNHLLAMALPSHYPVVRDPKYGERSRMA